MRYRSLLADEPHRVRAALLLGAAPLVSLGPLVWLMQPAHWTSREGAGPVMAVMDVVMLVSIGLIELFRTMNVASNAHATLVARDPVPVVPEAGTTVAFITTFVPGKEPLGMVRKTLEAAVGVRHRGVLHVWLLDEGDATEVREATYSRSARGQAPGPTSSPSGCAGPVAPTRRSSSSSGGRPCRCRRASSSTPR